ncbi:MAG: hypothetical protein V4558_14365 [Gemmatimonadota bacterium]
MKRLLLLAFLPLPMQAQALPTLTPLPVAASLQELDFRIDPRIALEKSGCLAMFNADDAVVLCADMATGTTRSVGHKGSGPGEFRLAGPIVARPGGGVVAYDQANARMSLISSAWKIERSVSVPGIMLGVYQVVGDSIYGLGVPTNSNDAPVAGKPATQGQSLVAVSLTSGKSVAHFAPIAADSAGHFVDPNLKMVTPFATAVLPRRAGGWYLPAPRDHMVFVLDAKGIKRLTMSRPGMPPEFMTKAEKARVEEQLATQLKGATAEQLKAAHAIIDPLLKRPKAQITVTAIAEDGAGRLWLATPRIRSDSTEVDVFSGAGKFLGTRRIPGNVTGLLVQGDQMVGVVEWLAGDREGMQGIVRYRVR